MSMMMRFSSKKKNFETHVTDEVILAMERHGDIFKMAGAEPWPDEGESEWDCIVPVDKLVNTLLEIRAKIKADQKHVDYMFLTRSIAWPGSDIIDESSGVLHGFFIDGELHAIRAGFNECVLERWGNVGEGRSRIVESKDVRHLKTIETEDLGQITIKKKKVAGVAEKWIDKVVKKLKKMEGDVVVEFA